MTMIAPSCGNTSSPTRPPCSPKDFPALESQRGVCQCSNRQGNAKANLQTVFQNLVRTQCITLTLLAERRLLCTNIGAIGESARVVSGFVFH